MGFIWFWIVAVMVAAYVVLDGFDIGVGILYPFLGRTQQDRSIMMRSIGPVWAAPSTSPSRCSTPPPSAASTSRS
jgi:cytochrome bd-type quinol oxidase subunit 2